MGKEIRDPKKEAADRMDARKILKNKQDALAGVVAAVSEDRIPKTEALRYVKRPLDKKLAKFEKDHPVGIVGGFMRDVVWGQSVGTDSKTKNTEQKLAIDSVVAQFEDKKEEEFRQKSDAVLFLEKQVSELRALAVIDREMTGTNPVYKIRQEFLGTVVRLVATKQGVTEIPLNFLPMFTQAERVALQKEMKEEKVVIDKALAGLWERVDKANKGEKEKLVGEGVDSRFAERKVQVKEEQRGAKAGQVLGLKDQALIDFLEQYPDPRVIIDMILEVKDGKLPL